MAGLGEDGLVTVVGGFELGGWDITASLVEAAVVEPVEVFEGGDLDLFDGAPGSARLDQFGLEQPDDRLGEGVEAPMSTGGGELDRWL